MTLDELRNMSLEDLHDLTPEEAKRRSFALHAAAFTERALILREESDELWKDPTIPGEHGFVLDRLALFCQQEAELYEDAARTGILRHAL